MSDFDDEPTAEPTDEVVAEGVADGAAEEPAPKAKGKAAAAADDDWDDDWDDRRGGGGGGRRDLTVVFGIVIAALVIALVVVATRDNGNGSGDNAGGNGGGGGKDKGGFCGDWPAALGGQGKNVAKSAGTYVWSDFQGIHVRSNNTDPVTVKVVGNKEFAVTKPGAGVQASAEKGAEVSFEIPAGEGTSGPDLNVGCEVTSIGFEVTKAGTKVEPEAIKVGDSSVADANPAQFSRDAG